MFGVRCLIRFHNKSHRRDCLSNSTTFDSWLFLNGFHVLCVLLLLLKGIFCVHFFLVVYFVIGDRQWIGLRKKSEMFLVCWNVDSGECCRQAAIKAYVWREQGARLPVHFYNLCVMVWIECSQKRRIYCVMALNTNEWCIILKLDSVIFIPWAESNGQQYPLVSFRTLAIVSKLILFRNSDVRR